MMTFMSEQILIIKILIPFVFVKIQNIFYNKISLKQSILGAEDKINK